MTSSPDVFLVRMDNGLEAVFSKFSLAEACIRSHVGADDHRLARCVIYRMRLDEVPDLPSMKLTKEPK